MEAHVQEWATTSFMRVRAMRKGRDPAIAGIIDEEAPPGTSERIKHEVLSWIVRQPGMIFNEDTGEWEYVETRPHAKLSAAAAAMSPPALVDRVLEELAKSSEGWTEDELEERLGELVPDARRRGDVRSQMSLRSGYWCNDDRVGFIPRGSSSPNGRATITSESNSRRVSQPRPVWNEPEDVDEEEEVLEPEEAEDEIEEEQAPIVALAGRSGDDDDEDQDEEEEEEHEEDGATKEVDMSRQRGLEKKMGKCPRCTNERLLSGRTGMCESCNVIFGQKRRRTKRPGMTVEQFVTEFPSIKVLGRKERAAAAAASSAGGKRDASGDVSGGISDLISRRGGVRTPRHSADVASGKSDTRAQGRANAGEQPAERAPKESKRDKRESSSIDLVSVLKSFRAGLTALEHYAHQPHIDATEFDALKERNRELEGKMKVLTKRLAQQQRNADRIARLLKS